MLRSPLSVSRPRRDASAGNRRTQSMVVALVLGGIGSSKLGDCLVEDRSLAEITCDGDAVAGPGMRASQYPAAYLAEHQELPHGHGLYVDRRFPVPQLPNV